MPSAWKIGSVLAATGVGAALSVAFGVAAMGSPPDGAYLDEMSAEPQQLGQEFEVLRGTTPTGVGWVLTAYQSSSGLCVDMTPAVEIAPGGRVTSGGCGFGLLGEDHVAGGKVLSLGVEEWSSPSLRGTFVSGPIAPVGAAYVEVRTSDGGLHRVDVTPGPPELGFDFYAVWLDDGDIADGEHVTASTARSPREELLGTDRL